MGPPSYMRSVVDRNVVMQLIPVQDFTRPSPQSNSVNTEYLVSL